MASGVEMLREMVHDMEVHFHKEKDQTQKLTRKQELREAEASLAKAEARLAKAEAQALVEEERVRQKEVRQLQARADQSIQWAFQKDLAKADMDVARAQLSLASALYKEANIATAPDHRLLQHLWNEIEICQQAYETAKKDFEKTAQKHVENGGVVPQARYSLDTLEVENAGRCLLLVFTVLAYFLYLVAVAHDVPAFRALLVGFCTVICDLVPEICNENRQQTNLITVTMPMGLVVGGALSLRLGMPEDLGWGLLVGGLVSLYRMMVLWLVCKPKFRDALFAFWQRINPYAAAEMPEPLLDA